MLGIKVMNVKKKPQNNIEITAVLKQENFGLQWV